MNIFTIYSLFYIILLNIIYFSKKRLKTFENTVFEKILITNLLGVLLAICSYYTIVNSDTIPLINVIVSKGYIIYLLTWLTLFSVYIFAISTDNDKDKENKKYTLIFSILYIIFLILIICNPLYYNNSNGKVYSYGPSANIMYVVSSIYIFIWVVRLIKNLKKIKNKKYLPIFAFMILAVVVIMIQKNHPELLLMTSMETFIVLLMFFTIENPDSKLLDEVHNAKIISDNANEEKSMFLYNVTNEIRSIGKKINNGADDILNETDNNKVSVENIKKIALKIKNDSAEFTTMTNEVFDITNVDSSNIKIYNEKYDIKELLREIISKYTLICKRKNIDFITNIPSDIPNILYGDYTGINNVITSVLDNSVKYTKKGYIELNISFIKKDDLVRLIISIEDSGIGIKSDELNKVFDKSEKKIVSKKNMHSNLMTAKKIINLMNGTIIANSTYGKGTTIKIVLDQKYEIVSNDFDKVYNKKKILLIEDAFVTYKLISKMLKNNDVLIDRVELGSEGLDKIRNKEKYDLIFIEEDLKPLNGYDIIKKLNQIKNFKTPTILLTKNSSVEYSYLYKDYGFSDYIIKPIDKNKLLDILNKY